MRRITLALLMLAAAAPAAPPRRAAPARATDWAARVTRAKDGAYVLGNPAAKVRVAEYMSYTCSHCAAFEVEGMPALTQRYIATGRVAIEVHHAIRDPFDTAAALLARCVPQRFFGVSHAIMAQQEAWMKRAAAYQPATPPPTDEAALKGIARGSGLDAIAAAAGVPPARAAACLASKPMLAELGAMRLDAWTTRGIEGTPAFFINGVDQKVASWAALEPKLAAAAK